MRLLLATVALLATLTVAASHSGERPKFEGELLARYPKLVVLEEWIGLCVAQFRRGIVVLSDPATEAERGAKLTEAMLNLYYAALHTVALMSLPEGTDQERAAAAVLIRQCAEHALKPP